MHDACMSRDDAIMIGCRRVFCWPDHLGAASFMTEPSESVDHRDEQVTDCLEIDGTMACGQPDHLVRYNIKSCQSPFDSPCEVVNGQVP